MRGNLIAHICAIFLSLAFGIAFTFFSEPIRDYYFRAYKKGAEKTGFIVDTVEGFPLPYVFVIAGVISLVISVFLIVLLVKKLIS